MDTLHPIMPNERLIAWGEYNYQVAGKDSGLTESWSLHTLPGEALIHRAEVRGRVATIKLRQAAHFVMAPDYRPSKLEMTQEIDGQITKTTIGCFSESIVQSIAMEDEAEETELEVPAGYNLFFPPVSAQGFICRNYNLETGGRQALPLVCIRMQPEEALPLSVEMQTIEYEYLGSDEEIETPAGQFACRHFIRYDQHMEQHLWFDQAWTPIQWSVPYSVIMKWEYLLIRYHRER